MASEAGLPGRRRRSEARPAGEVQARPGRGGPIGGAFRFLGESWGELQKVEWPKQNQVVQGTVVVLVACVIVGIYLYLNDQVWKRVVEKFLLGQ
jgi:preprotein translocase subunit SecE